MAFAVLCQTYKAITCSLLFMQNPVSNAESFNVAWIFFNLVNIRRFKLFLSKQFVFIPKIIILTVDTLKNFNNKKNLMEPL